MKPSRPPDTRSARSTGRTRTNGALYTTITLDDGQELETILHHGTGKPLNGDCNCPEGRAGLFCSHLVWVGLVHLGLDASPASALAAEAAPSDDLRPWLATLSPDRLAKLVLEAADDNLEYRRRLHLRGHAESPQS